jgi:AcrR family transcriptional regulator
MVADKARGGTDHGAHGNGRRATAERRAETRARLLNAVLATLAERGYAGTSTSEVARRSGLTRGAQLHHFGTKDSMMVAAVDHLADRTRAVDIEAGLADVPAGPERLHAALTIMAQLFSGVLPEAYVELWVASRSHSELADALRQAEVVAHDAVRGLFGQELLEHAGPRFEALLDLALYALRGMALDAHQADAADRRARAELILGLEPYFAQALTQTPTEH